MELFNEYGAMKNEDVALFVYEKITKNVKELLNKLYDDGATLVEIRAIGQHLTLDIQDTICEKILTEAMNMRRKERGE